MALGTFGSSTTTGLSSINGFRADFAQTDVGTLASKIKDDLNVAHPIWPGAFEQTGILYIPNRGLLRVLPGDYVGVDANGWPILVSKNSIATGGWTHNP